MQKNLKALLVDDEEPARVLLRRLLEETMFFSEIAAASSVEEALNVLEDFDPDIVFLDIRMPGESGFQVAEKLHNYSQQPGIVYVTAHEQYALRAVRSNAFDYLLKPVAREQLSECISRFITARDEINLHSSLVKPGEILKRLNRIRINTRNGTLFINPDTILFCRAEGNYTSIGTGDKEYLCTMNIGRIMEQLPLNGFTRIGRSYVINIEYLTVLDRKDNTVTLARDDHSVKLRISKRHIKDLDML